MTGVSSVLVANRGEIARRVFRTARAMGLGCVAVHTSADAAEPFVKEADRAVRLSSGYLDGQAMVAAALAAGADAVHPGYGFLSENAAFARAVAEAGLAWVGPTPEVIEAMGDKLAARAAAEAAGLAVLPSSSDPSDPAPTGFPLLVKAVAGGGGKGMRLVADPSELEAAVAAARREAERAFGDGRVYLERHVARARHVEIQVLADAHGNCVQLGERECSIQRRHQKIIEESPSPAVDAALRARMGRAAVELAASVGYRSAGTVELLLDADTGEFWFLEVNARLQVEHPVTEEVTGIDLVREQLRVAAGEPLGFAQGDVAPAGHAIEARLYAEDPAAGFLPAVGTLAAFEPADEPAVRWDSGVEAGSAVTVDFDPMLAKVIARAPSRAEAAARLALALDRLHLGGVTTNRHYLTEVLRSEAFRAGDTTTDFVERVELAPHRVLGGAERESAAVAAAMWLAAAARAEAPVLGFMPAGWRLGRLIDERVDLEIDGTAATVSYRPNRDGSFAVRVSEGGDAEGRGTEGGSGPDTNRSNPAGEGIAEASPAAGSDPASEGVAGGSNSAGGRVAVVHGWSRERVDVEWNGVRTGYRVTRSGDDVHLTAARGTVTARVVPRFEPPVRASAADGGLTAPMPGKVLEVGVEPGQRVEAGRVLMVLEAMKMEHRVQAPADGTVTAVLVAAGDQVATGTELLAFTPDDTADGSDGTDTTGSPPGRGADRTGSPPGRGTGEGGDG